MRSHNDSANTVPTSLTKSILAPLPDINRPITTNAATAPSREDKTVDQLAALSKFSSRIPKISQPYDLGISANRKEGPSWYANLKDKSGRATNEQALDTHTRTLLYKLIGREVIYEANGCVSTGKEVSRFIPSPPFNNCTQRYRYRISFPPYRILRPTSTTPSHPQRPTSPSKSTKTSILVFKGWDRYVTGEHRFHRGYSKNPRKMIKLWTEKEMRNLRRLNAAGIRSPEPVEVREDVLVMSPIGNPEGW